MPETTTFDVLTADGPALFDHYRGRLASPLLSIRDEAVKAAREEYEHRIYREDYEFQTTPDCAEPGAGGLYPAYLVRRMLEADRARRTPHPSPVAEPTALTEEVIATEWDGELGEAWCHWSHLDGVVSPNVLTHKAIVAFARRIYALAARPVSARERSVFNAAIDVVFEYQGVVDVEHIIAELREYRDKRWPAPVAPARAPSVPEPKLSDGSLVIYERPRDGLRRLNGDGFDGSCDRHHWPSLLNRPTDTGADFDKVKAYVAALARALDQRGG